MRGIVSDILTWPWFSEPHGYNFNGHLVRDPGGNICIDPVEPTEDDLDALVGEGVAWIILTNRNHSRAANRVRASTGARTVIHADDADHARSQETELDDALEVGHGRPLEVVAALEDRGDQGSRACGASSDILTWPWFSGTVTTSTATSFAIPAATSVSIPDGGRLGRPRRRGRGLDHPHQPQSFPRGEPGAGKHRRADHPRR